MRHVAEFDRTDADVGFVVTVEAALGENLDLHVGRITKDDRLGDAGREVGAPLVLHAVTLQHRGKFAKVAVGRNLKGDPAEMRSGASLESDRLQAKLGGEKNPIWTAIDDLQPDHARPVIDLPFNVRRDKVGVAEPMHLKHEIFP